MLNIKMFLAVVDGNIAVNRATDHLSVVFFCVISSVTAQSCYRVCLFFYNFYLD